MNGAEHDAKRIFLPVPIECTSAQLSVQHACIILISCIVHVRCLTREEVFDCVILIMHSIKRAIKSRRPMCDNN